MDTAELTALRARALRSIADSLGVPPELIAYVPPEPELSDEERRDIVEANQRTMGELMAHLNVTVLWPFLRAMGVPDPESYAVAPAGQREPLSLALTTMVSE